MRKFGAEPNRRYFLALRTIPTGDLSRACLAQGIHEAILKQAGRLHEAEMLQYGRPAPAGSTWEGLYIDDNIVMQKLSKRSCKQTLRDDKVLASSWGHYEKLKTPVSAKKAVAKAFSFQAWGTHVDTSSGSGRSC